MSEPQPVTAYVGVGANLGDREATIRAAIDQLGRIAGVRVTKISSLIENPAVGGPPGSPAFLNGAIEVETTLDARSFLNVLLDVERSLGRERRERWSPRTIDLDLLLYGDNVIDTAELKVPHPLMHRRDFVLRPMSELAPDVVHPVQKRSISTLLRELNQ